MKHIMTDRKYNINEVKKLDTNKNGIKTVKFGGSSLSSAEQFKKVKSIIESDPTRCFVVPSAAGKRFSGDTKITDLLYKCYDATDEDERNILLLQIEDRFNDIISDLNIEFELSTELDEIKNRLPKENRDYAASRGEYLCGMILAKYLGYDFIDSTKYLFFDNTGKFDSEKTYPALLDELKKHERAVIPGFYGSRPNGDIQTFSRGGSDITGSIVARASDSVIYENWTDVSGFLLADPSMVDSPKSIRYITYRELRELSYMGATVLHEDAIFPLMDIGTPINIRNTNAPNDVGTIITSRKHTDDIDKLTGIAGKKGFSAVIIEKCSSDSQRTLLSDVLRVLDENSVSFEHITSGKNSVSVILRTDELAKNEKNLTDTIINEIRPDNIEVENELALIAVVGRGMTKTKEIFKAISDSGIEIRMMDRSICGVVSIALNEKALAKAVRSVYKKFIK